MVCYNHFERGRRMYKVLLVDDDVHILNANETYLARLATR